MNEFDHEPIPGLPEELPAGESILWQGAPAWKVLARRAFHVVPVALYFLALAIWAVVATPAGSGIYDAALPVVVLVSLAVLVVVILGVLAWLSARSTIYTITTRRVVMRFGVALPISLNLPFRMIDAAGLRLNGDGTGDIPLRLKAGEKLAYLMLWPHARPWRFAPSEPMLRGVPQAEAVAQILARALASAADQPAQPVSEQTAAAAGRSDAHPNAVAL